MHKICLTCKKEFEAPKASIKKGYGKFCSSKCYGIWKIGMEWSNAQKEKLSEIAKEKGFGLWMKGRKQSRELIEKRIKSIMKNGHGFNWKGGREVFPNCWCGKKLSFKKAKTCLLHINRKMTAIEIEKKRKSFTGKNNPRWKGGITPINEKLRKSPEYKQWARNGKKNDDYRCFDCGERGGELESDHIYRFSKYPHIRLEPLNHQTLCKECHKQKTKFERTGIYFLKGKIGVREISKYDSDIKGFYK